MMQTYEFRARDRSGLPQQGVITADSPRAVAAVLRGKGYYITSIKEQQRNLWQREITLWEKPVTTADLALFTRQFSVMIDAGLTILSVLTVLVEQTENKRLKTATQAVLNDVQGGESLALAMGKHPTVFPVIMVSLVEAGELGGVLNAVMERLATQLEKEHKLVSKVKGAMTYPAAVLVIAALVVSGIVTFVLPTFEQLFRSAKVELPLFTQLLLGFSRLFRQHYLLIFLLAAGGICGVSRLLALPRLQPRVDALKLKLPVWGDISKKMAVARFSRTLATLLRGGVNILPALDVVKKVTGNQVLAETVTKAQTSIKEGHGLAPQLLYAGVFPRMAVRMIAIGEETGEIDRMLEKIADFFEAEVEDKLYNFSKLVEPFLVVCLAAIIGVIVVSIMLPVFEISSAMY
ncbi:MAG TPA: type II secretion system F family protein [Firmicutes bacterium]|nr:type II secretion system F family protein [Bacillota bacterium]